MSKHTPGPWRVEGYGGGSQYDVTSGSEYIGKVAHRLGGDTEAEANARLIALAPELLEQLKKCRSALQNIDMLNLFVPDSGLVLNDIVDVKSHIRWIDELLAKL